MSTQNFVEEYSTPEYELYEEECNDEPSPITYSTCIGDEIVLPKGNDMVSETVIARVKEIYQQPIGKADKNQILIIGSTMLNSQMVRCRIGSKHHYRMHVCPM